MEKIIVAEKAKLVTDYWSPHILAELNGQQVKIAKMLGEFVWHSHEAEDELFYVLSGTLRMELRDRIVTLEPGEMMVVPKGVEHRPVAVAEVTVLLFEPATTINTGSKRTPLTKLNLPTL